MKQPFVSFLRATSRRSLLALALAAAPSLPAADAIVDTFDRADQTSTGYPRLIIDDASIGGKSKATLSFADGVLAVKGQIKPARGQPGFVSMVLLLSPQGTPQDLSAYEGIRLRVRVKKGGLSVLACSSEVVNFDFHAAAVARGSNGLEEIKIPFRDLKRVWSEQTELNLETITSINLVASGVQPSAFAYEIDEVGFY